MQSPEISKKTGVSPAETAKVLQLLVLGGFVTSRRGYKGGFQLAGKPGHITTGQVIDFFLSKHTVEDEGDCPVMCALRETMRPAQNAFAKLTLSDIVSGRFKAGSRPRCLHAGAR